MSFYRKISASHFNALPSVVPLCAMVHRPRHAAQLEKKSHLEIS